MIVVSDAGPLIYLGAVGQLELLPSQFERVLVPDAVWKEVVGHGESLPGANAVREAQWIDFRTVADEAVGPFTDRLDPGEAAALVLAIALHADLLLVDDLAARRVANAIGIPVVGTLGILLQAKMLGRIPAVRPILLAMTQLEFRVSAELLRAVLNHAGE